MEKIKKYYKLCGVKSSADKPEPFASIIEPEKIAKYFNNYQLDKYFTPDRMISESVIGANERRKKVIFAKSEW